MILWVSVDGERKPLIGRHEDIIERTRELRADGHKVEMVRQPPRESVGPRGYGTASSHIRR